MDVELFDQDKPVTVRNFIRYVQSGAYENMILHRCLPRFVVQGGGFSITNRSEPGLAVKFFYVANFGPITNEFNVGRRLSNAYGTLAMAKLGGDPNSASSQWFFNLADNSANLDYQNGGFTVFGRVVRGTNVLEFFNKLEPGAGLVNLTNWYGPSASVFSDLPVNYTGFTPPYYPDLMYVDISLLSVQVNRAFAGSAEIGWNSISNRLNHVEYTTNFPPAWQLLKSVNGTGARLSVTDWSPANRQRFYRVRVDY
jgi:cyclophilin family peptidyl-prolyl cis-trans isomerase